jgi:trans-aconitate methyltransferase
MSRLKRNLWNEVRFWPSRPRQMFQHRSATTVDRYPAIFGFVQQAVGRSAAIRILSFGCATGEEVETLRAYFPAATIKGMDINPFNIATCRRRLERTPDPKIAFEVADSASAEPAACYDAIFCLAVLRRSGLRRRATCLPDIRFEDFERCLEELARTLRPGGLLVLKHCSFRFTDTAVARGFEVILRRPGRTAREPVLFDRNHERLLGCRDDDVVFKKRVLH